MFPQLITLLSHKDKEIQKKSLVCIKAYKAFIDYKKISNLFTEKTPFTLEIRKMFEDNDYNNDQSIDFKALKSTPNKEFHVFFMYIRLQSLLTLF